MDIAIEEAKKAFEEDEVPVGAVLVMDGKIIGKGHNLTKQNNNNLDHAEIVAIKDAIRNTGFSRFPNSTLYVTLEPCLMCSGAIYLHKISKIIFALKDPKFGAIVSTNNVFESKSLNFTPEIELGENSEISKELLRAFFQLKRK